MTCSLGVFSPCSPKVVASTRGRLVLRRTSTLQNSPNMSGRWWLAAVSSGLQPFCMLFWSRRSLCRGLPSTFVSPPTPSWAWYRTLRAMYRKFSVCVVSWDGAHWKAYWCSSTRTYRTHARGFRSSQSRVVIDHTQKRSRGCQLARQGNGDRRI